MKSASSDHVDRLWRRVERFRSLFEVCPFVRMVAVTNSLAMGTSHAESDIDLFIVAEAGHLYTVRLFLKIATQIFGVRVHHDYVAGRFCMSFFVTTRALNLEHVALPFDPHLAEFARTMMPICGSATYGEWCAANKVWIARYGAFVPRLEKLRDSRFFAFFRKSAERVINLFDSSFERLCKDILLQRDRAYQQRCPGADCILTDDIFKFHEKDPRRRIARTAEESLTAPLPRPVSLSRSHKNQTFDESHSPESVGMKSE